MKGCAPDRDEVVSPLPGMRILTKRFFGVTTLAGMCYEQSAKGE